jgi:glycosyltransferase involved in cell wall biosynthesis
MATTLSVVIPTHNRRETVCMAVRTALAQTRAAQDVIVVCDGCTDGTQEAVAALGSRVVVLDLPKGRGFGYENRNRALHAARGDAVVYCGDDDLWLPDHLEHVGARFDAGAGIVQAMSVVLDRDDRPYPMAYDWSVPYFRHLLMTDAAYTASGAIAHRIDAALAIGGWNGGLERLGDLDLWRRLVKSGAPPAMTGTPTALIFQAFNRGQPWPERVAQNARWLARIEDPDELSRVRAELDRAFREADAWRLGQIAERDRELAALRAELDGIRRSRWWRLRTLVGRIGPRA